MGVIGESERFKVILAQMGHRGRFSGNKILESRCGSFSSERLEAECSNQDSI